MAQKSFGDCCASLKEALATEDFEPLLQVGEDGILYMAVGLVPPEGGEDEPSMIDHPMFFCPFCGTKQQTPEEVDQKMDPGSKAS